MITLKNIKPFGFQKDTVNLALKKIEATNGVYIMDLTGLGKTITSLTTVINIPNVKKLLVVAPTKNRIAWMNALKQIDIEYIFSSYQKLPTDTDFDAIIIDEAHNLRNTTSASYKNMWFYIRAQQNIPYVILLSATPYQNTFTEFFNTLSLIPFKSNTFAYLMLGNYIEKIKASEKVLTNLKKTKGDYKNDISVVSMQDINKIVENDGIIRGCIDVIKNNLGEFCIRNTRDYIAKNYQSDMETIGMFPNIIKHDKTSYKSSLEFDNLISNVYRYIGNDDKLPFAKYNLQKYIKLDNNYIGMNGIMRSFLLKRLDSSLVAFIESVNNMLASMNDIYSQYSNSEFSNVTIGENEYQLPIEFFNDCLLDIQTLNTLLEQANKCSNLDKENSLFELLKTTSGKTIVFTEYKATLNSICDFLEKNNIRYIKVDSDTDEKILDIVSNEFDANLDIKQQTNDYQVLVATDVLSEGCNLHRAVNLVHYDSKWNPQRTIQRNGRVDRLFANKKINHTINIYTYAIDKFIDSIIRFENKTTSKLELSEILLDFDWVNYNPISTTKFKIGMKYLVHDDIKTDYIGFITNSNMYLITNDGELASYMSGYIKTISFINVNEFVILESGMIGIGTCVGGKHEVRISNTFGEAKRDDISRFVLENYYNINFSDIAAITNSHVNKKMITILTESLMKIHKSNKTDGLKLNTIKPTICDIPEVVLYQKVIDNIIKINNSDTIKYYQIVSDNRYMK